MQVDEGEHDAIFLHFSVWQAYFSEHFGASYFEVNGVVGMINDAHLVSFGISDT